MDSFKIEGTRKLQGTVYVSGAKNAILPVMAACLLAPGKSVLRNVPNLIDLKSMSHLLRVLGARIEHNGTTMSIDAKDLCFNEAPYELVSKMRASIYVLGPLLARLKEASVSFPGGCAIGTRPVDLHLKAFETLGADIQIEHGYIHARAEKLIGADIFFEKSSVGATINVLMAAVLAKGKTTMHNAAMEPEVDATIELLNKMGAKISGKSTTTLVIEGVEDLFPVEMTMIPDRIEAGTFLIAGALSEYPVTVKNCLPSHLGSALDKLREAGCELEVGEDFITINPPKVIKPFSIITLPYPGFPTDLQ
ncbi:MAG TPA: UDP-N-acetylglucosamine 1-carboxyvinyltransferase, partial [Candidatus Cloacimonadota bacterium]|nr:UDP-N-acetylglucosamine 1-carboxyvinyltransferase [Candidatus Cloacimonadota bacterium]